MTAEALAKWECDVETLIFKFFQEIMNSPNNPFRILMYIEKYPAGDAGPTLQL